MLPLTAPAAVCLVGEWQLPTMAPDSEHDNDDPTATDRPAGRRIGDRNSTLRCWSSSELFGGTREVIIEHAGEHYRLRATSRGKLILTK